MGPGVHRTIYKEESRLWSPSIPPGCPCSSLYMLQGNVIFIISIMHLRSRLVPDWSTPLHYGLSVSLALWAWCRTVACLRSDRLRILISVLFAWWDPAYRANPKFGFQWLGLVKTVINPLFPQITWVMYWILKQPSDSRDFLSSIELIADDSLYQKFFWLL
jgi:hypothetical protein